jgi:hypothetical protein
MTNLYINLFTLVALLAVLFARQDLIITHDLTNKFTILIILILINTLTLIYRYYKKSKSLKAFDIIKSAVFYGFIGTFAYIIFGDISTIEKLGISKNINLRIIFYSLFITCFIVIFNESFE